MLFGAMSLCQFFANVWLRRFSTPRRDRAIYEAIYRLRPACIVEVGLRCERRALRMMKLARQRRRGPIEYVGIDLFESRPASTPGMTLKRAHRMLRCEGAAVRLFPGSADAALTALANRVTEVGVIVIEGDPSFHRRARCIPFLPRMLADGALLLWDDPGDSGREAPFSECSAAEIRTWARGVPFRRAA